MIEIDVRLLATLISVAFVAGLSVAAFICAYNNKKELRKYKNGISDIHKGRQR